MKRPFVLALVTLVVVASFITGTVSGPQLLSVLVTNFPLDVNGNLRVSEQGAGPQPTVLYLVRNVDLTLPRASPNQFVSLGNVSIRGISEVDLHVSLVTGGGFSIFAVSAPDSAFPGLGSIPAISTPQTEGGLFVGGSSLGSHQINNPGFAGAFVRILPTGGELRVWASSSSSESEALITGLTVALYLIP